MKSAESLPPPGHPAATAGEGPFHFAGFTLDTGRGLLSRGGVALELRPKSFALLCFLARNSGRVLSKDELLDAVWNDVTVTEDSLTQCIRDIRLVLGSAGEHLIRTLPRRGYLFDVPAAPPAADAQAPVTTAAEARPRIAVLPFRNLGGRPEQDYLSAGISEDIITALARFSSLTVTGQHVTGSLAPSTEPDKAASLLGVTHIVDGSVRFAGDRIRITARLLAVRTGLTLVTLWADNFDRARDDVFAIQDEVVTSIAAALDDRLVTAGADEARQKPMTSWSAYDCLLQGRALCNQHREAEALPFFQEAARRDPTSAEAHGWHAIAQALTFALTADAVPRAGALESGRLALRSDERNDAAHWGMALALQWNGHLAEAEPHLRRAMQLNPANIHVRGDYANWLRYAGRSDEALREIETATAQDPFTPQWFEAVRAAILFDRKDYTGALAIYRRMPFPNAHLLQQWTAACAWLGDDDGMAAAAAALKAFLPHFTLAAAAATLPYADRGLAQHVLDGLRKAGFPA